MKTYLYAVRDQKAQIFGQVFQLLNDDIARRTLTPVVNNPEHNYGQFPEDYSLYNLGEYNDIDGIISDLNNKNSLPIPEKICELIELRKEPE